MRSRRGFIGGMVGTTVLLSGCIGALQTDGDGDSGDDAANQHFASPVGTIFIRQSITSASTDVQVSLLDAERVLVERNGRQIDTITSDTNGFTQVDQDVESGDLFELVAIFPDGSRETIYDRCYDCDGSDDGTGNGGTSQPDPEPDPDPEPEPSPDPQPDPEPDPNPQPDPEPSSREVVDTRRSISEDRYLYWGFELDQQATVNYSYTVHSGPEIDVFIMTEEEFSNYENGNSFRAYGSQSGTSGSESATIPAGAYRLAVDNTESGAVAPPTNFDDDIADVEIQVTVEQ